MANQPFTPKALYDFLGPFDGGLDMGKAPLLLNKNELQESENITVRGSFATTRPSFQKRTLSYSGGIQAAFEGGKFQGACYYKPPPGLGYLYENIIASISGVLYRLTISGNTVAVDELVQSSLATLHNSSSPDIAWLWQCEKYLINQDGQSVPIIFDGNFIQQSNPGSPGVVVPGQVLTISGTQPIVATDGSNNILPGSQTHVVYPPVGGSVVVNLQSLYTGSFGIILDNFWKDASGAVTQFGHFKILPYSGQVVNPQPAANATLTNVNDNTGGTSVLTAGTQILQPQSKTVLTTIATITGASQLFSPNGTTNLTLSAVCNVSTVVIKGYTFNVTAGGGTNNITILGPPQDVSFFSSGTSLNSYVTTTLPPIVVGVIAPPSGTAYTSPAIAATINVNLAAPYTGTSGLAVTINGYNYTIAPYSAQGGGNNTPVGWANVVILQNVDAPPTNDSGQAHWFYTGTSGTSYLSTPSTTTPGTASTGIPIGRMGCYGMGRNWICLADGQSYWASDMVGGASGTKANNYLDAILQSKDNTYLAGGGLWTIPGSGQSITAMVFTAVLDTSLGQGPMAVLTPSQVFTNQAPTDRAQWSALGNPLQTVGLLTNGALGHYSTIAVNGDTIFRSIDGIRSYILARRDFDVWGNVPISHEVNSILDQDNPALLFHGSAIVFQNRMLMTANPISSTSGCYHTKLVVLNFDPLSTLRGKEPSVYDGIWTGLNVLHLVKGFFGGVERAFAFCLNTSTGKIELHEIMSDLAAFDDDTNTPITSIIASGSLKFGQEQPHQRDYLRLIDGEIIVSDLKEAVTFTAYYRPDQQTPWNVWRTFTVTPASGDPGFRPRLGLGEPPDNVFDSVNNRPMREGYTFDFKLVAAGSYTFLGARFKAVTCPAPEFAPPAT